MRILLVSPKSDGAWFVWLFQHDGNNVSWTVLDPKYAGALSGLIPPPLERVPNPSSYDLIVYDASGHGEAADEARRHTPVIGGSALADKLEDDRLFGIEFMEHAGIRVPDYEVFDSPDKGIAWLEKTKKRTVFKPMGDDGEDKSITYVSKSDRDMIDYIDKVYKKAGVPRFLLQEVIIGTEVSTEAWWSGDRFVALNHTLEEKKFMTGGIGPNTGCSGNALWMPNRPNPIFQQGLEKVGPLLDDAGVVGPFDLNTIVTEGELYGLEWTPRFGYEGACNLAALLPVPFADFLYGVAIGAPPTHLTARAKFSATIRLSVPPYPNADTSRLRNKVPIKGLPEDLSRFILYDCQLVDGQYQTEGNYNAIGSPIGLGDSLHEAFEQVTSSIRGLEVPDLQWRNDVPSAVEKRYTTLERQGWLRPLG